MARILWRPVSQTQKLPSVVSPPSGECSDPVVKLREDPEIYNLVVFG